MIAGSLTQAVESSRGETFSRWLIHHYLLTIAHSWQTAPSASWFPISKPYFLKQDQLGCPNWIIITHNHWPSTYDAFPNLPTASLFPGAGSQLVSWARIWYCLWNHCHCCGESNPAERASVHTCIPSFTS